jgi:hypothetical protein
MNGSHPIWCVAERCTAANGGEHRSPVELIDLDPPSRLRVGAFLHQPVGRHVSVLLQLGVGQRMTFELSIRQAADLGVCLVGLATRDERSRRARRGDQSQPDS